MNDAEPVEHPRDGRDLQERPRLDDGLGHGGHPGGRRPPGEDDLGLGEGGHQVLVEERDGLADSGNVPGMIGL